MPLGEEAARRAHEHAREIAGALHRFVWFPRRLTLSAAGEVALEAPVLLFRVSVLRAA